MFVFVTSISHCSVLRCSLARLCLSATLTITAHHSQRQIEFVREFAPVSKVTADFAAQGRRRRSLRCALSIRIDVVVREAMARRVLSRYVPRHLPLPILRFDCVCVCCVSVSVQMDSASTAAKRSSTSTSSTITACSTPTPTTPSWARGPSPLSHTLTLSLSLAFSATLSSMAAPRAGAHYHGIPLVLSS